MPPECGEHPDHSPISLPAAVYQFGMLVRLLFGGECRLAGRRELNSSKVLYLVERGEGWYDRPEGMPDAYWDFVRWCCAYHAGDRPTFEEIVRSLTESTELVFPGTDMVEYARYRSSVNAERMDAIQIERVRDALARYKQSHPF
jgi:hypothetical protein